MAADPGLDARPHGRRPKALPAAPRTGRALRAALVLAVIACLLVGPLRTAANAATAITDGMTPACNGTPAFGTTCANVNDGSDATYYAAYTIVNIDYDFGAPRAVTGFRVASNMLVNSNGWCTLQSGVRLDYSDNGTSWTGVYLNTTTLHGVAGGDAHGCVAKGYLAGVGELVATNVVSGESHRYWRLSGGCGGNCDGGTQFSDASLYGDDGASINDYVRSLSAQNQLFAKTISWTWRKSWQGEWRLTRANGSQVSERGQGSGGTVGASVIASDVCGLGGCGGPWTLTIHDSLTDHDFTYEIANDANGTLIAEPAHVQLGGVIYCYNAQANQCTPGPVGTLNVTYRLGATAAGTLRALVVIGPQDRLSPAVIEGPPAYSVNGKEAGTYTVNGLVVGPGKSLTWLINASNDVSSTALTFTLPSTGSSGAQAGMPIGGEASSCGPVDVACAVKALISFFTDNLSSLIQASLSGLFVPSPGSVSQFQTVGELANSKSPLAEVAGAASALAAAASTGASETSVCLHFSMRFGQVGPGDVPICLDAVSDLPGWPLVRTFAGGAVYLTFALGILKQMSPRPVVAG